MTRATAEWLASRGVRPDPVAWDVAIALDDHPTAPTTRLHLAISSTEWSIAFERTPLMSWIRVVDDVAESTGRDDFQLASRMPGLANLGTLVASLERQYDMHLRRLHAVIRTNLPRAESAIRLWVVGLL